MVKGNIKVIRSKKFCDMKVGEVGFISSEEIIITPRNELFIEKEAPLMPIPSKKDFPETEGPVSYESAMEYMLNTCVKVKRVGDKMSQNDFILDFKRFKDELFFATDFDMEDIEASEEYYLKFTNVAVDIIDESGEPESYEPGSSKSLQEQLDEALGNDDFEKAATIRDEMTQRKNIKK